MASTRRSCFVAAEEEEEEREDAGIVAGMLMCVQRYELVHRLHQEYIKITRNDGKMLKMARMLKMAMIIRWSCRMAAFARFSMIHSTT